MSDNDFNYNSNEEKDPLNGSTESPETESKPEEPAQDAVSGETSEDTSGDASSEDTQEWKNPAPSEQAEQPKEDPYRQPYQNPYSSYGQNQNPYGQNQGSYGQNQNPYGQSQNSYGQNQNSYGQSQNSYGQNQNSYGQNQNPYGQNQGTYGQGQNSYGQNQNSYGQNGQYRNPYGTYNNPYGNNGSSYGYGQNQNQNQNHQQPYWSYPPYSGQYQSPNSQQPGSPKKKNRGLKVFLWILGILVVGTVTAFSAYSALTTYEQKNENPSTASSQEQPDNGTFGAGSSSSSQAQIEGKASGDGTNPNSSGIVINQIPSGSPLSAKAVYKKVAESVVGVDTQDGESQGTGIVATADGYILTNAHVVNYSRANKVTVILHNGKEYAATVVGYDKTSDLAVLRINATNLTPAEFGNSDQLEVGDSVVAIGNPGGLDFASSLTGGMVSAVNRSIESHSDNGMTYIQTDAAINPGNSGGPLVDMYGQVIGINSNKIVATGYEGMGFSIPISKARSIINDLIARGYVSGRSRLGITATTITEVQAQLTGYPTGVLIREISGESDLKKSNVVAGDIITKADGQKITSMEDLLAMLNKHKAGDTITLTIYSPGTSQSTSGTRDVKTKLLEDKGETQAK